MVQRLQNRYSPEKLNVVLLSTDQTQALYDRWSPDLFTKYGGGDWTSCVLPNAMNDSLQLGGQGYGKVIVDEEGIVRSLYPRDIESVIDDMFLMGTRPITSPEEAKAKGAYWYKDKCWRHFEAESIAKEDIDRIVKKQLESLINSSIEIGDEKHIIESADFSDESNRQSLTLLFSNDQELRITSSAFAPAVENGFGGTAEYRRPKSDADSGISKSIAIEDRVVAKGKVAVRFTDSDFVTVAGTLRSKLEKGESIPLRVKFQQDVFGIGNSQLEVDGDRAVLSGTLGAMTFKQIQDLIASHAEVKTIEFNEVEGSVNDEVNMHTGRIIRQAGLNTLAGPTANVASGGVDLFCAGVKRTVTAGAKLGVHSWSDGTFDGSEYPKDHPAHQYQSAYFSMMLGDSGNGFYYYSLEAAPADDIHYMADADIQKWKVSTNFMQQ